jgi:hypothetical protein
VLNSLMCSRKESTTNTNTKTISSAAANGNLKFNYGCIAQQVSVAVILNTFIVEVLGSNLPGTPVFFNDDFVISLSTSRKMAR